MMRVKRSVTIDEDVWKRVKEEAKKEDKSASRYVEDLIKSAFQYDLELRKILDKTARLELVRKR